MSKNLKVAIIGNMNNNNFSLMRYLRDLGIDAHLFPFENDGKYSLSHFSIEADTWHIEKWKSFIHRLDVQNNMWNFSYNPKRLSKPIRAKYITETFKEYDRFIGTGLAPAIFSHAGLRLNIYYPYSTGVEFVGEVSRKELVKKWKLYNKFIFAKARKKQIKGIREAKYCFTTEVGAAVATFEKIGKPSLPIHVPMVYNKEKVKYKNLSKDTLRILECIKNYDFKIISHARHLWVTRGYFNDHEWSTASKNNNWILKGYNELIKKNRDLRPILLLFEYGPDVKKSKKLIRELKIEEHVLWVSKKSRKEIMVIIEACDVGIGGFVVAEGQMWGGAGLEILASGKPLLQPLNVSEEYYISEMGHPIPPILDVKEPNHVYDHFQYLLDNAEERRNIGNKSLQWFESYAGEGLAKQWLTYLDL